MVVYESMFGNTRAVAEAIADSLARHFDRVDVLEADAAPLTLDGVSLVVVGAPTHAFGMSRPSTRRSAAEQGAAVPPERGVREWLAELHRPAHEIHAAVFDTRIRKPPLPGSAAGAIGRRLRRLGFTVLGRISLGVTGTQGPLGEGELERAERWAAALDVVTRRTVGAS